MTFTLRIRGAQSSVALEYLCDAHGIFEAVVERPEPDAIACPECGAASIWTISGAPGLRFQRGAVRQGKAEPPPHQYACDTRDLGEGMPLDEWKAKRAKMWNDYDYKTFKEER